jgi:hypothetical protein
MRMVTISEVLVCVVVNEVSARFAVKSRETTGQCEATQTDWPAHTRRWQSVCFLLVGVVVFGDRASPAG